jgi:NAD(P)-dependent dehydrogenase (short-subunit alcohol dehydrogenase family)
MLPSDETERRTLAGNVPVGRLSKPEEVTKAVVSLVESPFVTAQTLSVDGEMHPR